MFFPAVTQTHPDPLENEIIQGEPPHHHPLDPDHDEPPIPPEPEPPLLPSIPAEPPIHPEPTTIRPIHIHHSKEHPHPHRGHIPLTSPTPVSSLEPLPPLDVSSRPSLHKTYHHRKPGGKGM